MNKRFVLWTVIALALFFFLRKLKSNKAELLAETQLSLVKPAFTPVETTQPVLENLGADLQADGIFMPFKEMFVISETAGRVLEIHKNKGEWLNEGDLIAKVDDEMLNIELEATKANLRKLQVERERLKTLIEGEAAPKNKIEDLDLGIVAAEAKIKGLNKQIANTYIKAPMTGTLGLRFIERGSVIGPGIQVAQMTNLQKLLLYVKVTERDIFQVKKGQNVQVSADVLPDKVLSGKVTNIGLRADNTFNYDVEIEVNNPNDLLRAGMHAKAAFVFNEKRRGLTIPRNAVIGSTREGRVFVVKDSLAVAKTVEVGQIIGEKIEIKSGLTAQDKVVVGGQLNLEGGEKVRVVKEN